MMWMVRGHSWWCWEVCWQVGWVMPNIQRIRSKGGRWLWKIALLILCRHLLPSVLPSVEQLLGVLIRWLIPSLILNKLILGVSEEALPLRRQWIW